MEGYMDFDIGNYVETTEDGRVTTRNISELYVGNNAKSKVLSRDFWDDGRVYENSNVIRVYEGNPVYRLVMVEDGEYCWYSLLKANYKKRKMDCVETESCALDDKERMSFWEKQFKGIRRALRDEFGYKQYCLL